MRTPSTEALSKARKLHMAKKYAEAAEAYGAALGGNAAADVLESRGWCYLKSGRPDEAIADFTRADFLYGLAKAYQSLGRTEDAIRELQKDVARKAKASKYSKPLLEELTGKAAPKPAMEKKKAPPASKLAEPGPIPARKKSESYDAYATRLLEAAALGKHAQVIEAARVPGVILTPQRTAAPVGASRIGGLPDLPPRAKWPSHRGTPMLFVMQVRLEELPRVPGRPMLPKGGLLSFFACEGLGHDEYLDAGAVVFTPARACGRLAAAELPAAFVRTVDGKKTRRPFGTRGLAATVVRKLPNPDARELRAKLPDDVRARYSQRVFEPAMASEEGGRHQLLGVRDRSYPGDQPASMTLLLQCVTEPSLGLHWGDDDAITFFAPRAALAKADFSKVRLTYGD